MFVSTAIIALKQHRAISLTAGCADTKATAFRKKCYDFRRVDVVLLEGIFLFKPTHRHHFDISMWIDCSFEAALERAIGRGQEGLPPEGNGPSVRDDLFPGAAHSSGVRYPRGAADFIFTNDKL